MNTATTSFLSFAAHSLDFGPVRTILFINILAYFLFPRPVFRCRCSFALWPYSLRFCSLWPLTFPPNRRCPDESTTVLYFEKTAWFDPPLPGLFRLNDSLPPPFPLPPSARVETPELPLTRPRVILTLFSEFSLPANLSPRLRPHAIPVPGISQRLGSRFFSNFFLPSILPPAPLRRLFPFPPISTFYRHIPRLLPAIGSPGDTVPGNYARPMVIFLF